MDYKEVIAALRSTPSRSKRELFDTEADMIEAAMDKPVVSNADRIRAMSDEDLAEWYAGSWNCRYCSEYKRTGCHPLLSPEPCDWKCEQHCLEWLQQPVKEDA